MQGKIGFSENKIEISDLEHDRMLKFSRHTHFTHIYKATPHLVYPHLVYPHYVYYFDKVPHFVYSATDTVPHLVYFHFVYIWSISYSKQKELSYIYLHIYTYSNNINNTITVCKHKQLNTENFHSLL